MVILKPLQQALQDNDTIRSVIVGTGINQDGKTPGITMPNGMAQGMLPSSRREMRGCYVSCDYTNTLFQRNL